MTDSDGTSLTYRLRTGETGTFEFAPVDTFVEEIGHFAAAVRNGARPLGEDPALVGHHVQHGVDLPVRQRPQPGPGRGAEQDEPQVDQQRRRHDREDRQGVGPGIQRRSLRRAREDDHVHQQVLGEREADLARQ